MLDAYELPQDARTDEARQSASTVPPSAFDLAEHVDWSPADAWDPLSEADGDASDSREVAGAVHGGDRPASLDECQDGRVTTSIVRHPIFARVFDRLSGVMERDVGEHRQEMLAGLSGRVVEVGAGNGMNFAHYPATVDEVAALEPEAYLRAKAEQAASRAPVDVTVRAGVADALPFQAAVFDAVVASLVLCSVSDPAAALAEMRRVLKPGGELRFMEHVRSEHPGKARVQRLSDRSGLWPRLAGGCHCDRDTVGEITAAGFRIARVGRYDLGPSWILTNPHARGVAALA